MSASGHEQTSRRVRVPAIRQRESRVRYVPKKDVRLLWESLVQLNAGVDQNTVKARPLTKSHIRLRAASDNAQVAFRSRSAKQRFPECDTGSLRDLFDCDGKWAETGHLSCCWGSISLPGKYASKARIS